MIKTYSYKGKKYTTKGLQTLAKDNGIKISIRNINLRRIRGWSIEKIVTTPKKVVTKYEYQGKKYTILELADLAKQNGISLNYRQLSLRLHDGWSIKRAITTPQSRNKSIYEFEGKTYQLKDLVKIAHDRFNNNISTHAIYLRLQRGWDVKKSISVPIIEQKRKTFIYQGKQLKISEIIQLAKQNGVILKHQQVYERIRYGWSIKKIIATPKVIKRPYEYQGKNYSVKEVIELAKENGIDLNYKQTVSRYYHGWSTEKIITTPIKTNSKKEK